MTPAATSRLHYFDAIRAFLMLLGLPYHVARIYAQGGDSFVTSDELSLGLEWFSEFLHSFRMEAFFAVAGFFGYLLLRRGSTGAWLQRRMVRVAVPLIFCTLALAPLATAATVFADIRLGALPPDSLKTEWMARMAAPSGWVYHLWFLHTLLLLSFVLAALRAMAGEGRPLAPIARLTDSLVPRFCRLPGFLGAILLAGFCLAAWILELALQGPLGVDLSPLGSFFRLGRVLQYLPFFLIGAMLARQPQFLEWMVRPAGWSLPIALALSALFATFASHGLITLHSDRLGRLLLAALACGAGIFWLKSLLALGATHLSGHNRWVTYFSDASYTIYVIHMPIALWLGAMLIGVPWPPLLEFSLILAATLGLSMACHETVRRSVLLSLLMNGVSPSSYRRLAAV